MQVHVARNGQRMGPFSLEEINRQLAAGTLNLTDLAWYEGAPGWVQLSTVPGVTGAQQAPAPTVTSASPITPTPSAPTASTTISAAPTEPLAIWSLVLSLLAICGFCCTPVVITGIAGVVCGHLALSKIRVKPELQGRGLAMAGLIIGYCALFSWLLWVVFFGGIAVMHAIFDSISK
jgi:hypothetical protein